MKIAKEKKEEPLYEPIKNLLQTYFKRYVGDGGRVYLEITANGQFSEELKEALDDRALTILRVERFSPDITGFLQKKDSSSKELVTVEIKSDKIKINHIYRAKLYADVLNAKYGIIISPKRLQEEIRRFIKERYNIIYRTYGSLIIAQFDRERNIRTNILEDVFKFDEKLYPTIPEPFKSAT